MSDIDQAIINLKVISGLNPRYSKLFLAALKGAEERFVYNRAFNPKPPSGQVAKAESDYAALRQGEV